MDIKEPCYALRPFDYSSYFDLLVDYVIEGNFEVSRESLVLIDAIIDRIPNKEITESLNKINDRIDKLVEDVDFLNEAKRLLAKKIDK